MIEQNDSPQAAPLVLRPSLADLVEAQGLACSVCGRPIYTDGCLPEVQHAYHDPAKLIRDTSSANPRDWPAAACCPSCAPKLRAAIRDPWIARRVVLVVIRLEEERRVREEAFAASGSQRVYGTRESARKAIRKRLRRAVEDLDRTRSELVRAEAKMNRARAEVDQYEHLGLQDKIDGSSGKLEPARVRVESGRLAMEAAQRMVDEERAALAAIDAAVLLQKKPPVPPRPLPLPASPPASAP